MKKLIGMLGFFFAASAHAAILDSKSNFGSIDILTWQAREGGADNWAKTITTSGTQVSTQLKEAPFNWNQGVRLAIGHLFAKDSDINFVLTHYNTTATSQASGGTVYSSWDGNYFANNTGGANFGPSYTSANIKWQIFYNTFDIDVGHQFRIDTILSLHPHLGFKIASINQSIDTNWLNPTTTTDFTRASENLKNNFSGIGPTFGVDTQWPLFTRPQSSISLIGNVSAGLLWGQWDFSDVYSNNKPVTITVRSDSIRGLSPMVSGLLGVQWNKHFNSSDLSLRLGYEEQVWLNQMQLYALDMGKMNRSSSFQGANLEIKFVL